MTVGLLGFVAKSEDGCISSSNIMNCELQNLWVLAAGLEIGVYVVVGDFFLFEFNHVGDVSAQLYCFFNSTRKLQHKGAGNMPTMDLDVQSIVDIVSFEMSSR